MSREATLERMAAHGISVGLRTLVTWENDPRSPPRCDYVEELARMTGTDPAWLLTGTDSPAYAKLERIRAILDEPASIASAEAAALEAVAAVRQRHGRKVADR